MTIGATVFFGAATAAVAIAAAAAAVAPGFLEEVAPPRKHSFQPKQLSGPPEEFEQMARPTPERMAVYTAASTERFTLSPAADGTLAWSDTVVVDSSSGVSFGLFCRDPTVTITLTGPNGKPVPLGPYQKSVSLPFGDDPSRAVNGTQWNFPSPTPGRYKVTLISAAVATVAEARRRRRRAGAGAVDGYLLVWNESPDMLYAHVSNANSAVVGSMVGVVGRMVDADAHPAEAYLGTSRAPPASSVPVTAATLVVTYPDGTSRTVPMKDDGLAADGAAGDAVYGGAVEATAPGTYRLIATLRGITSAGAEYERVFEQEMVVDAAAVALGSVAVGSVDQAARRLKLRIPAKAVRAGAAGIMYRPYAEVWGTNEEGATVPVTFATALAPLRRALLWQYLELDVDLRWVARANVTGPLTLKNVYVQNIDTLSTHAVADALPVRIFGADELDRTGGEASTDSAAGARALAVGLAGLAGYAGEVTWEMLNGVPPPRNRTGAAPTLVLVHGFCADKNPFELQSEDWTDAVYYSAAREGDSLGRPNSQFADDVLAFIERQGLDTFGMVGQSQGGMIGLHILNYFHTGLDAAVGERKIQSVATPFMGNTALSTFNGVIDIIGGIADCKGPYDLTRSGAMEWNAGIANANAAQANYYYTQYSPGGWFGEGYCNSLMNVVLNGKNDGVCEVVYASPDSRGTDRGLTLGWCHAEGMEFPPSFWDKTRNAEMNAAAAR